MCPYSSALPPHSQVVKSNSRTLLKGLSLSAQMQSVYSAPTADWAVGMIGYPPV